MSVSWGHGVTLTVEVGFASSATVAVALQSWTDISAYVRHMEIDRGRSTEVDDFQAGRLNLELDNRDRRFDPLHASSPYAGNLLPMKMVRVTAEYNSVSYPMFVGYVDGWPQAYEKPDVSWCRVSATDAFKVLANLPMPDSVYTWRVPDYAPYIWYRLEEPDGRVAFDSSAGGTNHASHFADASRSTTGGLIPGSSARAFDLASEFQIKGPLITGISNTTGKISMAIVVETSDTNTIRRWLAGWGVGSGSNNTTMAIGLKDGYAQYWQSSPTAGTHVFGTTQGAYIADGRPHLIVVTQDGTGTTPDYQFLAYVDGSLETLTAMALDQPAHSYVWIGGERGTYPWDPDSSSVPDAVVDEVIFWNDVTLTSTQVAQLYQDAFNPLPGQRTDERLTTICDMVGWSSADRDFETGTGYTAPVRSLGSNPLQYMKRVAETELGQLYMDEGGDLVFRGRGWRLTNTTATTSQATFGDSGAELPYTDIEFSYDETFLVNSVTAQREDGSPITYKDDTSVAEYYERNTSIGGLLSASDNDVRELAHWLVEQRKDPHLRVTSLTFTPIASPSTLFPQALGRKIGERVTVRRRPQNVGTMIEKAVHIEAVRHTVTFDRRWQTTWYLSPTIEGNYFVLDNSSYGQLDDDRLMV